MFFIMIFRICIVFIRAEKALYVLIADYNLHHYTIEYNNNMSNFELEKNTNNTDKIVYNYPKVSINKNEITSTATELNMTFYNSSQDPNIIYTKGGKMCLRHIVLDKVYSSDGTTKERYSSTALLGQTKARIQKT